MKKKSPIEKLQDTEFERRMQMDVKELNQPVEQNPNAFERAVDWAVFQNALDGMRKHFTAEEIRGFVEKQYNLESTQQRLNRYIKDVYADFKPFLEETQAELERRSLQAVMIEMSEFIPEMNSGEFKDRAEVATSLQSWSVDILDEIDDLLERNG